ncbi:MAG: xanthine dehydrogenase small subunit [Woeseiaceae bacterium]|nr:xanthine dehydrogenase small subunit [Woeseiaceae bacterium]
MAASDRIQFVLDGNLVELTDVDPTRTVLQYLREDLRRTGTKEGCAEGDCGACTVVVAEQRNGKAELRAINSCIQFVPTLHGKELLTVESLCRGGESLHPVQQAMVDNHGSQCGFCTPGFVMSLYALYETNPAPTRREIDDALAGNLCRCTGYRPIVAAARAMYQAPRPDGLLHPETLAKTHGESLAIEHDGRRFFAPVSIAELAGLCARYPDATLLAGGTDVGLWVTKQHRVLDTIIHTGRVAELHTLETGATHIDIGAAVSLTDAMAVFVDQYPQLEEIFLRFASPPIRNAGTLGGNVANGSPIGDSMPALMAAGTTLVLRSADGSREIGLDDFYHDYMQNDLRPGEFLERIRVPLPGAGTVLASHKLSKRFDQDISAVCTAYRLELDGDTVSSFRMACGGMAATIRRARQCEQAVTGQPWNQATLTAGRAALAKDFTPISDMRATAAYRLRAAQNLLTRFYLETTGASEETVYAYGRQG